MTELIHQMRYRLRTLLGQIRLRNIFLSIFSWALWCLAIAADVNNWTGSDHLAICAIAYRFAGPCIAIGALFGRIWIGALVGLTVVACLVAYVYIYIVFSLIIYSRFINHPCPAINSARC